MGKQVEAGRASRPIRSWFYGLAQVEVGAGQVVGAQVEVGGEQLNTYASQHRVENARSCLICR
jgi:hypothetical protein